MVDAGLSGSRLAWLVKGLSQLRLAPPSAWVGARQPRKACRLMSEEQSAPSCLKNRYQNPGRLSLPTTPSSGGVMGQRAP